jgi:hypothetical protein
METAVEHGVVKMSPIGLSQDSAIESVTSGRLARVAQAGQSVPSTDARRRAESPDSRGAKMLASRDVILLHTICAHLHVLRKRLIRLSPEVTTGGLRGRGFKILSGKFFVAHCAHRRNGAVTRSSPESQVGRARLQGRNPLLLPVPAGFASELHQQKTSARAD